MRPFISVRFGQLGALLLTAVIAGCAGGSFGSGMMPSPQKGRGTTTVTVQPNTTILPTTAGRFGLIQLLDDYGRANAYLTAAQIQSEAPHEDSVWGAFFPSTWNQYHAGMIVSRYYLPNEDAYLMSGHNLAWFQTNHPDWILYGCDNNNNPTAHYAYADTGFANDVPLDLHNPAVVAYQMQYILLYLQTNHYNALAIDNVVFKNYLASPNPILEKLHASTGWYGCGIYTQGPSVPSSFVRRYNAPANADQSAWVADTEYWIAQAKATLHPAGIKVIVNHPPFGNTPNSNELQMLGNIDAMLDENGFTHYGTEASGNLFTNTLSWMLYLQSHNIAFFITDYYCYKGTDPNTGLACTANPASLTAKEVDWALATYALGNNGGADLYVSPEGGATYTYRPEYAKGYGIACAAYSKVGTAYVRRFTDGYAIVNPVGGTVQNITLPAHSYTDIEARALTKPLTVSAGDAYMLLTTANTCT